MSWRTLGEVVSFLNQLKHKNNSFPFLASNVTEKDIKALDADQIHAAAAATTLCVVSKVARRWSCQIKKKKVQWELITFTWFVSYHAPFALFLHLSKYESRLDSSWKYLLWRLVWWAWTAVCLPVITFFFKGLCGPEPSQNKVYWITELAGHFAAGSEHSGHGLALSFHMNVLCCRFKIRWRMTHDKVTFPLAIRPAPMASEPLLLIKCIYRCRRGLFICEFPLDGLWRVNRLLRSHSA